MINFRYHIVSLTAVFLSLVIGIAMGTTVVSKATVDGLRTNLDRVEARSTKVQGENEKLLAILSDRNITDDALEERMLTPTVAGVLDGVPVVVITSAQTDRDMLDRALRALGASGADLEGTLVVNDRLLGKGQNTDRIAEALGVDPDTDVARTLISRMSALLASKAGMTEDAAGATTQVPTTVPEGSTTTRASDDSIEGTTSTDPTSPVGPDDPGTTTTTPAPTPTEPALITELRSGGFLEYRPAGAADGDLALTGDHYRYVVLADVDPEVANTVFFFPFLQRIADLGPAPVVAVSGVPDSRRDERGAFTSLLHADKTLSGRITTIDNLDSYAGMLGLVYGIREVGDGRHGQYGLGDGTTAVIPAPGS